MLFFKMWTLNVKKKGALLYSRLQGGQGIMNGIKFEFNDISLYKKNDSERRRYVSLGLRHII